jgi:DM4/DM12 family
LIIHVSYLFSPGKYELLSDTYRDAEKAGKEGADCVSLYPKCPKGDGLLDSISVMI